MIDDDDDITTGEKAHSSWPLSLQSRPNRGTCNLPSRRALIVDSKSGHTEQVSAIIAPRREPQRQTLHARDRHIAIDKSPAAVSLLVEAASYCHPASKSFNEPKTDRWFLECSLTGPSREQAERGL